MHDPSRVDETQDDRSEMKEIEEIFHGERKNRTWESGTPVSIDKRVME